MDRLQAMREGGDKLGNVRLKLFELTDVGVTPRDLEQKAQSFIHQEGGVASFATVRDYRWATCINVNDGVVHGIPENDKPFKDSDLVMLDVGLLYKGYHTDSAFTKLVGTPDKNKERFLEAGRESLKAAIEVIKPGVRTGEISRSMGSVIKDYGYTPAIGLTGHGVGKTLHQDPMIPCFLEGEILDTPKMSIGQTLAIEVIYMEDSPELVMDKDGWTISTRDGKLSAVFEETVEVTSDGHSILTKPPLFQRS